MSKPSVFISYSSKNKEWVKDYQIIEDGETLSLSKKEMKEKFQEHFKKAKRLVKETGYHRKRWGIKRVKSAYQPDQSVRAGSLK